MGLVKFLGGLFGGLLVVSACYVCYSAGVQDGLEEATETTPSTEDEEECCDDLYNDLDEE